MQSDSPLLEWVADDVMLVGRDQAAHGASSYRLRLSWNETVERLVGKSFFTFALVLYNFEIALKAALYTPGTVVIMNRGSLAGSPGHGDDATTGFFTMEDQMSSVAAVTAAPLLAAFEFGVAQFTEQPLR